MSDFWLSHNQTRWYEEGNALGANTPNVLVLGGEICSGGSFESVGGSLVAILFLLMIVSLRSKKSFSWFCVKCRDSFRFLHHADSMALP